MDKEKRKDRHRKFTLFDAFFLVTVVLALIPVLIVGFPFWVLSKITLFKYEDKYGNPF